MKPVFKMTALAMTVLLALGCQKESEAVASEPVVEAAETAVVAEATEAVVAATDSVAEAVAPAAVDFANEDAKAAYAIGSSLGQYLATNLEQQAELGLNMDSADVLAGVTDAFSGNSKLDQQEIQATLTALDERVATLVNEKMAAESQVTIDQGNAFRGEFEAKDGVVKTESGLLYTVLEAGEGNKPAATDTVEVHYRGKLIDGTEFDSSYSRNQTASFPLNQVIPGWTEGLQLMPVGSKFQFVIPPELAYGSQNTPTIPANSTLIFDVELLSIPSQAEESATQ